MKTPGQICFEAYNESKGGLTYDGKPIPAWDTLTDDVGASVRAAWDKAAQAAARAYLDPEPIAIGAVVVVAGKDGKPRLAETVARTERLDGVSYRVRFLGQERERDALVSEMWRLVKAEEPS